MKAFVARFSGVCADCGGPVVGGADLIQYNDDNEVVHTSCAGRERAGVTCPKCFMQKPCECDDPDLAKT